MRSLLFCFFLIISCFNTKAKNLMKFPGDTAEFFPIQRFEGGVIAFYAFLQNNLYFPAPALRKGRIGTCIAVFTVSKRGALDHIEIINSLHRSIDAQIISVLKKTNNMWLPAQNEEAPKKMLFLPITYIINDHSFLQNFEKPYYLRKEMVIKAQAHNKIKEDQYYAAQANVYYQNKQYEEAIEYLNELIRRNPYNKELYLMRGNAYYQTGKKEKACQDFNHIKNFLRKAVPIVVDHMCL